MAWPYRSDEVMVLKSVGAPTASRDVPTLNVDVSSGLISLNQGNGTTWNNIGTGAIEVLTAARVLVAADHGKTFYLSLAGGFTVTLPANATAGFSCKFIVKTAPTTAYIVAAATADTIAGSILSSSGGAEDTEGAATGDQVNFVANTALVGDRLHVDMDGTSVYVFGICSGAGGMTITG